MKRAVTAVALALSTLSGCGTVCNLQGGGTPYGGVSEARSAGTASWGYWRHPQGACIPPSFDLARAVYLFAVDLPLSAVGDTLTLPVTICWRLASAKAVQHVEPLPEHLAAGSGAGR